MNKANTLFLMEPGRFAYEYRVPVEPGQGEVRVRIDTASVCGSDVHAINGKMALFSFPRVLGHEAAGIVEAIGEGVDSLKVGDHVCLLPCKSCGTCLACRHGAGNCCKTLQLYGVHLDGGMQETLTLPAEHFLLLPKELPLAHGALIEPFTIGMHAVRKLGLAAGDMTLVVGAGPIGVCCAQIMKSYGANVYLADTSQERRAFVEERFGFRVLDPLSQTYAEEVSGITSGEGFYALADTTANKYSMDHAYELIGQSGRIVYVGILRGMLEIDEQKFHMKEPSLFVTRNSVRRDYEDVVQLMQAGRLKVEEMVSHRVTFSEAANAMLKQASSPADYFKQQIIMTER